MIIIGIAGGSASGKTSLAIQLKELLENSGEKCELLHLDQFFIRDLLVAPTFEDDELGGRFVNFNHPGVVDTDQTLKAISNADSDWLIIEGHLLFSIPELREKLHFKIFLDVPDNIRLDRRIQRDQVGGRMSSDPQFITRYYLLSAAPGYRDWIAPSARYADLTLDGTKNLDLLAKMAFSWICKLSPTQK